MFTGIVEHVGRLESMQRTAAGGRICVHAGLMVPTLTVAASIAVNGCCLTVVEVIGELFSADLSAETLRRTGFGEMPPGKPLNLERPLTTGKELGGHFVQGHVDGVGRVARLSPDGVNWWLGVRIPAELDRYVALKGSIAVDGISLTVANIADGRVVGSCRARSIAVEAAIIPFTYANTNLQGLAVGDSVNLEVDILAKYVERLTEARRAHAASRLTIEHLINEGF